MRLHASIWGCSTYNYFGLGMMQGQGYVARAFAGVSGDALHRAYLYDNELWIKRMSGKEYIVIDIGPDFPARRSGARKGLSPYWYMEYSVANHLPNYINRWSEPYRNVWSYLPIRRFEW